MAFGGPSRNAAAAFAAPSRNAATEFAQTTPQPRRPAQMNPAPIVPGNIDVHARPVVRNPDGSISTVLSMSIGTDEGEVLIPQVSDDGRILNESEAIDQYRRTGRHLGIFRTPDEATGFAQQLHRQQEIEYGGRR